MSFAEFCGSAAARRRYWAGSLRGWPPVRDAAPNPAHRALAALERAGRVARLVTQNVDGLHQRAGSRRVTDLHGRLDGVECLVVRRAAAARGRAGAALCVEPGLRRGRRAARGPTATRP